jgi:transposase
MKFVKALTEEERQTLWDAARYAPWMRFRQRTHAVYLSGKGYRLDQLADIFLVDRDTVSDWLDAWESQGLLGLRDRLHPGRPRKGTQEARDQICREVEKAPHQARALPPRFEERTATRISFSTLKRWLKEKGWVWKRCRRSLKDQRDQAKFEEGQRVLAAFHEREAAGEIDVFYLDESGLSSRPNVPYAWQRRGSTRELPANVPGRLSVIGLLNRENRQGYFHAVEGAITHATVIEAISGFIQRRTSEKLTVIVMDNASIHKKAVEKAQWHWLADWVWIWFLPSYSPELNVIEILWKKIKYEWLPWAAYQCFDALREALQDIFANLGTKYRINFG